MKPYFLKSFKLNLISTFTVSIVTRSIMFAIGHFALGYLTGKSASKLFNVKVNLSLLLAVSVIPDVDLLFLFMSHRGLTHSIIVIGLLAIPFAVKYKKAILPYLAAILSHIFIGDLFPSGVAYLWPITKVKFGLFNVEVTSLTMALVELTLFFISIALMYKQNDLQTLFKPANKNWLLLIASGALIGPLVWLGKISENPIPALLIIPSIAWLCVFAYSLLIELRFKIQSG